MIYKDTKEINASDEFHNIIVDLDNCLFDSRCMGKYVPADKYDRKGWDIFASHINEVHINFDLVYFLNLLEIHNDIRLFFITSREDIGTMKLDTDKQIRSALRFCFTKNYKLFMREKEDYRPACEVKEDILLREVLPKYNIDLAIDDSIDNVNMYQKFEIDCLHYTIFNV